MVSSSRRKLSRPPHKAVVGDLHEQARRRKVLHRRLDALVRGDDDFLGRPHGAVTATHERVGRDGPSGRQALPVRVAERDAERFPVEKSIHGARRGWRARGRNPEDDGTPWEVLRGRPDRRRVADGELLPEGQRTEVREPKSLELWELTDTGPSALDGNHSFLSSIDGEETVQVSKGFGKVRLSRIGPYRIAT